MNQIHGHDVIEMMLTSGQTYTRESLAAAIRAKFGQDARFFTCSDRDMTAEQMVAFLEARGKLAPREGGFNVNQDAICQH